MTREIAGVDGCPAGWIAVIRPLAQAGKATGWRIEVHAEIGALLEANPALAAIAIDMPIGLPDRIIGPGRAAETHVRQQLGARQSSVFSIPARSAVEMHDYRAACAAALATSDPPRKVSKQGFNIFGKIREVDALLRARPGLADRMIETHPEVIFRFLSGRPLAHPKKSVEGQAERKDLLRASGMPDDLLTAAAPRGAVRDDLTDAIACSLVAGRHAEGLAIPNPPAFQRDRFGLPVAIWT